MVITQLLAKFTRISIVNKIAEWWKKIIQTQYFFADRGILDRWAIIYHLLQADW